MKRTILFAATLLMAGSILAADSSPKDDVSSAIKKLANAANYSWHSMVETPNGGRFRPGPVDGQIEKDGFTVISAVRGDNTNHAVLKGDKGAIKADGDWQSLAEAAKDDSGDFSPSRFFAMSMKNFKTPTTDAEALLGASKDLKLADGTYSADLTEDGAKARLSFRPPGGDGPTITGAKGSVKFWIADGVLSKYELKVQGKVEFNGNGRDIDRTTTVTIKDVGTTKIDVSDDVKKKIG